MIKIDKVSDLDQFLQEKCEIGPDFRVAKQTLYDAFLAFLEKEQGSEDVLSKNSLGRELSLKGFAEIRTKTARSWSGIGLLSEEEQNLKTSSAKVALPEVSLLESLRPEVETIAVEKSSAEAISDRIPPKEQQRHHFPRNDALNMLLLKAMGDPFPAPASRQI